MLHTIKKDVHQIQNKPELELFYNTIAKMDTPAAYAYTKSKAEGLDKTEAQIRLKQNGLNTLSAKHHKTWVFFLFNALSDEFILVFFLLGFISIFMSDPVGAIIIFILALFSTAIRFYQDFHAYVSSEALKQMIHTTCDVFRDGQVNKINIQELVIGDIIQVRAGSLIPADIILVGIQDLYITQAMFTGESLPIYKSILPSLSDNQSTHLDNICLMGTSVSSGSAKGLVFATGANTYLGHLAHVIESKKEKTNFEKGIHTISQTLLRYMVIFVSLVFLINGIVKGNWLEAFMFSISVAIGLTPGMLPMIVNGTLSKGSLFLAKKKTIVKHLEAIENMGGIDVLCTDKTGTLTQDNVILKETTDSTGQSSSLVYTYAYLNSTFSTGIHNSLDE
ncbi:MAG: HAD-IC family P-type ATPase, partial [Erysipelotrichaceae bacterium]